MDANKLAMLLITALITASLAISGWYLQRTERELQVVSSSLNDVELTLTEVRVSLDYFSQAFASHVGDPDNHPDNTERVNRLREDFHDLEQDIEVIMKALDQ